MNRAVTAAAAVALLAATAIPAAASASAAAHPDQSYINWPGYLNGVQHSSYNAAATSITTTSATSLVKAWTWHGAAATMTGQPGPSIYSSPTVYDGVIYIGTDTGDFYAINESTGTNIWSDFLGFVPKLTCPDARGVSDTAWVGTDPNTGVLTVYVSGGNGYLYALNAATGATIWQSVIELPSPTQNNYYDWASPTVANGHVYIGLSSQCNAPNVRGGLNEYNQTTGALQHSFQTGTPTSKFGASIWASSTVDSAGNVYITTGNDEGQDDSVIRLNGNTLGETAHWKLPLDQQIGHDSDFGGSNTLWTATLNGTPTEMVGDCNKNGTYYAFNAADINAGPVWQDDLGAGSTHPPICAAAAVYNGTNLWLSGPPTTIDGTSYAGSIEEVDPATGTPIWQTGLGGSPIGTPSLDGSGVLAVQTYSKSAGFYLINSATGAVIAHLATGVEWGQPVFADNYLLIPTQGKGLWAMTNAGSVPSRRHG
jgi:outer membrane protein assembly factor BamB